MVKELLQTIGSHRNYALGSGGARITEVIGSHDRERQIFTWIAVAAQPPPYTQLRKLWKNSTDWSTGTQLHTTPNQKEDGRSENRLSRRNPKEPEDKTDMDEVRRGEAEAKLAPRRAEYAEGWPEQSCHRRQPRSDEGKRRYR
jgi:hypothetical protein